jgi:hypothetical protein
VSTTAHNVIYSVQQRLEFSPREALEEGRYSVLALAAAGVAISGQQRRINRVLCYK